MKKVNFKAVLWSHSGFQRHELEAQGIVLCACNGFCEIGAKAGFSSYRVVC
jgi:hypothetical protein